jgi:ABC-type oligopeptide transport system substrate-binding subunit
MARPHIVAHLAVSSSLLCLLAAADSTNPSARLSDAKQPAANTPKAILFVGVRELPESLSPATAWTDVETQSLELLFEALVQQRYDPKVGQIYVPELAADFPAPLGGGRRFRLAAGARWSDGTAVTSLDVRHTAQLEHGSGRAPEWEDLLDEPRVEDDRFHIDFQFRQWPLDPLARLAFKVLPQTFRGQPLARADDPAFAREPVGSGPFRYAGRKTEDGQTFAVFTANPYYHRPGKPHIREIRLFAITATTGIAARPAQPWHLLLDVPTDRLDALAAAGMKDVRTFKNRRVYFLAVNHRVTKLADQNLRRALAHAIDRESILNDHFRGISVDVVHWWKVHRRVLHPDAHQALNGPFPTPSWACAAASRVPPEPRDAESYQARLDLARTYAKKAAIKELELTLKYPNDDPRVADACRDIAEHVARLGNGSGSAFRLKLLPMRPHQLKEALDRRDYELAYCHLDYADESYWLWPLFDTRPDAMRAGGSNFLGYTNDATLESLFRKTIGQRNFGALQEQMQALHAHLYDLMPLVPLWQLDRHLAIHPSLNVARLDPCRIFNGAEDWPLQHRTED